MSQWGLWSDELDANSISMLIDSYRLRIEYEAVVTANAVGQLFAEKEEKMSSDQFLGFVSGPLGE